MKKLLVLFLLITANFVYGQYTPMLEIGKIWNMRHFTDFGTWSDFDLIITETVEINDQTYYHIESTRNNCETFLREDIYEKKIYAFWEGEEYVKYDFGLDIGEYIWVEGIPRLITDIGYGDFYGMENLRYYLLDDYIKLIEGIGFKADGISDSFEDLCLFFPVLEYILLINMNQVVSISEITSNKISLYPNPTTNQLFISNINSLNMKSLELYDVLGKRVLQEPHNFKEVDVSSLKSGIYLVKIETDKGVITKKVVKK